MANDRLKFHAYRILIIVGALLFGTPFLQYYIVKYLPFLTGDILGPVATFLTMLIIFIPLDLITRKVWAI